MKRGVLIVLILLVVVSAVLLIIGAVRSKPAATVAPTLTIWSPFDEAKVYERVSAAFIKDNPGVVVDFRYVEAKDAKEYEAKVVNALADGNGPDIWLVRSDWIPKHVDKSLPAVSAKADVDPIAVAKTSIMPKVVDANSYNGKLYGLPLSGDALAIIYNEDFYVRYLGEATDAQRAALGNIAKTWDDLKTQVEGISRSKDGKITRSAIALGTSDNTFASADVLGGFLVEKKAAILSTDRKDVTLNLAVYKNGEPRFPATEALSYYTSFAKPDQPNFSWSSSLGDPIDAFLNQRTGALIGYYSTLQTILSRKPTFAIKLAPMVQPVLDDERTDYGVTWSHIVNKDSAHGTLAWSYLGSLLNPNIQNGYAEATSRISIANPTAPLKFEDKIVPPDRASYLYQVELQNMAQLEKPEWQTVDEIFQDMIKQVVSLGQTAQNSVDSAAERLKALATP